MGRRSPAQRERSAAAPGGNAPPEVSNEKEPFYPSAPLACDPALAAGLAGCVGIAAHDPQLTGITPSIASPGAAARSRPVLPPGPYQAQNDPVTGSPLGRPLAVMIENHPAARPQSGLGEADVVYEALTEGGITRFLAIYRNDNVARIGPVRSARPHFIDLMQAYDPVYVHCGQSWAAEKVLAERKPAEINQISDPRPFWRDPHRRKPHNLYTSTASIERDVQRLNLQGGLYTDPPVSDDPLPHGKSAPTVQIGYPYGQRYSVGYQYDAGTGRYLRVMNGQPHVDALTHRRISASTLIVQETEMRPMGTKYGEMQIDVLGTGRCWFFRGGQYVQGTWHKEVPEMATMYFAEDGTPLLMGHAPTWVQIVPTGAPIRIVRR